MFVTKIGAIRLHMRTVVPLFGCERSNAVTIEQQKSFNDLNSLRVRRYQKPMSSGSFFCKKSGLN